VFEISFPNRIAGFFPNLKRDLRIAHIPFTPSQYVRKGFMFASAFSVFLLLFFFLIFSRSGFSPVMLFPAWVISFIVLFLYYIISIKSKIRRREREIDREVIFVGRYMLVKLYSGRPLLNALIETSESRGIAAKYIKEIVEDISTGSTIEEAIDSAMVYSPSQKLRKILFYINNALQLGIDVTKPLDSVLEEITKEDALEIKKYGKKLNTLVLFYMLLAVILPSLGVAIFIVIASFINLAIGLNSLLVIVLFIAILEFIFISIFKSTRPMLNL
jgi:archaeal flagellar protein FlaJ